MRTLLSLTFLTSAFCLARGAFTKLTGDTCKSHAGFDLCNDEWGAYTGTGSQTSYLMPGTGNGISWVTTWTWSGAANSVKSYANAASTSVKGMTLSNIKSIPSKWKWYYKSKTQFCADVSYDIWFGTNQNGDPASSDTKYEIMIWLGANGSAQPIGSLKQSGVSIAGYKWDVYAGANSHWETISFVARQGDITTFDGDLAKFFEWLTAHMGVSSSLYLHQIAGGTETFTGSAEFVTDYLSISVTTH